MPVEDRYKELVDAVATEIAPGPLSELRVKIAGEYVYTASLLEEVLVNKPAKWLEIRDLCTSDSQADNKWARTDDGVNETRYRLRLKSMEKLMSAIKTRLDIMQGEMRNQV